MSEKATTETLDRLYLEWSQFTNARNARELQLIKVLEDAPRPLTDPTAADLVPYMDWFFKARVAAIEQARRMR